MFRKPKVMVLVLCICFALTSGRAYSGDDRDTSTRMVLVELYTSQGCDMCPAAEKLLGSLAGRDRRIVPIAFHVDYFNEPWKDVFSDPLYSKRQAIYNELYTKPKNAEYGLYYTPMLMIDGEQSVNGRDPASAEAAIRQARARKPLVAIDLSLDVKDNGLSGTAEITVTSRSPRAEKSPLLVCAVLREDDVVTDVRSGENAGKSLVARFPRVKRSSISSSSTASRRPQSGFPSRSSPPGIARICGSPYSSRTSAPASFTRQPIFRGEGPQSARTLPLRAPLGAPRPYLTEGGKIRRAAL